jgi:hypothetical protein
MLRKSTTTMFMVVAVAFAASGKIVADDQPMHLVSAEVCKTCHEDVYRQWQGSMHAKSTALHDAIHGVFYQMEVGDPKAEGQKHKKSGTYPVCLNCHAPNAARDEKTKLDDKAAYSEGVNCVACHTLKSYKGIAAPEGKMRLGIKAYELSGKIQGPEGFPRGAEKLAAADDMFGGASAKDQKPNPHLGTAVEVNGKKIPALPMESNPRLMKSTDACMGCHDKRNNPQGVALCQTGDEYQAVKAEVNCSSCHMPIADGIAHHGMGGGHDLAMLKRAVLFDMDMEKKGDKLLAKVNMKNQNPHSLPTGAPFRNMYMKLIAYNSKGEVVWQSAPNHPMKDDPQAYLHYEMVDAEGKPTMPPTATGLGKDARLKPHETRTLAYEVPAKDVVLVRAELYYNLLWANLVEKFKGQLPKEATQPMLVAVAEKGV